MKTTQTHPSVLSLFGPDGEPSIHTTRPIHAAQRPAPAATPEPVTEKPEGKKPVGAPAQKRPHTAAEREARRSERAGEAKAILSSGLSQIAEDPEALARYLRFRSQFHQYSPTNTVLILMQRPTARYCMGYRAWQKHGRQVRRGERGLMIYAPILAKPTKDEIAGGADPDERKVRGFRVATTFDYEQTDAAAEGALVYESPAPRLSAEAPELVRHLEALAAAWGYSVEPAQSCYADGYCNFARRVIGVRDGLSGADRAAVLAHELAHAAAHEPKRSGEATLSKAEREMQAEGAAFMALYQMGVDTQGASLPYLKAYAESDEALLAQLGEIERIASLIIDGASGIRM